MARFERTSRVAAATLLGAAIVAPNATAQVLEEVVVTAQKREQSVQDVGISVSAFTGEQMDALGYTNAQEVSAMAPGVSTIQPNGPSNYALAIRGVAQNDFVSNQESPVSIYVDEVYMSQMSSAGFMLFDMDRVEILRGPQGTLFGRNATGGLAQFVTRKPTQDTSYYGEVTVGSYEQVKFEGAAGGALTDRVAGRVSIATHHNGGYVENRVLGDDINNANDYAGRGQLLFDLTDNLSFLFNVRGALQQIRTGFFENASSGFDAQGRGFYTPGAGNFNGYEDTDGDVFAGDYNRRGHQDMSTWGTSGTFKWTTDAYTLTSITDFQTIKRDYTEDSDASPVSDFNFYLVTDAEQFSQELRLNGEREKMRWVTGFYYLDIEVNDANGAETPLLGLLPGGFIDSPTGAVGQVGEGDGTFLGNDNPYTTETNSWSIFGQLEYDLTEQFTGIIGFRWIEEEKDHHYENNLVDFQPGERNRNGNPNVFLNTGTYDGTFDKSLWSARIQLDWRPNDDWLWYASWNRGVKGGGFNSPLDLTCADPVRCPTGFEPLTDDLMAFDEEMIDAYEVGFKSSLFGGLARLNGAGFYYDYQDYQAFRIVGLSTFILNADAESHGFELELQTSPLDGLDLLAGVGYVDVEIPGIDIGFGPIDTKPVQSPKWTVNGMARYSWPAFGGNMAVQGDFVHRSKHFFSLTQAQASTENGYVLANTRVSWTNESGNWEGAFFVKNVTDEEYLVQTFDLGSVLGMTEQYYGLPRWFGGSIRYSFD